MMLNDLRQKDILPLLQSERVLLKMPVTIFLAVNVKSGKEKQVQTALKNFEEVTLACAVSAGPYNVVALVEVPSLDEYKSFSIDKVGKLQHITDYTSFIAMDQ